MVMTNIIPEVKLVRGQSHGIILVISTASGNRNAYTPAV